MDNYKDLFSLTFNRTSFFALVNELIRARLSFTVTTPSGQARIREALNQPLLDHMRATGIRFSDESVVSVSGGPTRRTVSALTVTAMPSLWKPAQAININLQERPPGPRKIRLQSFPSQLIIANDFTFNKYHERAGSKLFDYQTDSGLDHILVICACRRLSSCFCVSTSHKPNRLLRSE